LRRAWGGALRKSANLSWRDRLPAEHDRKLFRLTAGGDIVLDNLRPFEGDSEEEAERGHRDDDRAGGKTPFLRQVDQIRPDLI
jgi:hypothetical protein